MDVVTSVRNCLITWSKGGESECRNMLISPHCNPSDPSCVDVLTTAYHTLLSSALTTWSPENTLSPNAFIEFVQSVLNDLPSSSSTSSMNSSNVTIFGEHLVDMIWSVDAQLDEILSDAKSAMTNCGDQAAATPQVASLFTKAKKARQNADSDKETVQMIVKRFLDCGIVNPAYCRERLDSAILASVGLIPDKGQMDKKEIRARTGLFYKQNKFNLLREQSEGYSKLTAELTSSLGPAHSPATGRPTEPYSTIEERARPVWEKVISLIGYFDLDPNRALDIVLDVLSVHLTTHHSFFVALLSFSPWAGSYRRSSQDVIMPVDLPPNAFSGKTLDEVLTIADRKASQGPAPTVSGAKVLAQVLGFKFAYYQDPDVAETTPKSLYLTAAILIRDGFISLEDLYPHVLPRDDDMETAHKAYLADVQSRISGAKTSQLAMAAPLESSSSQSKSKPAVEEKKLPEPKQPSNQKADLLSALLSVGALKPAFAIMSRFPWLVDAHPEIADLMLRIMTVSISTLYQTSFAKEKAVGFAQPRARYGTSGLVPPSPRKAQLTLWAPTPPSTIATDFVFFYPDWREQVPVCSVLDDLVDVIEPIMRFIGPHVSRDTLFLTKFLRLARMHLHPTIPIDPVTKKAVGTPDPEHPVRVFWFRVIRKYLLPAISLIRGNAVCTSEVWNIIRQYETTARWRLYGEWRTTTYKSHPELRVREVQADRESKGILRRLSTKTIESLSGPLAKLAHSNPCIFFANAVNQLMAYENLAEVVIQALKYVTNLGFDVFVYIILEALANPNKERVKEDGVHTTDWLQSLASFIGMLFRRFQVDLSPILKYVVHQLQNEQTTEIVVLRELIWKMAGIEPLPSMTDSQVAAMAGGPALRIESLASKKRGAQLDPEDQNHKSPKRLGGTLLTSSLALPLLIQIAQQRQACVFKAPNTHLKSLASLYDTIHGVFLQYLELLTDPTIISPTEYATDVLPSLADLGELYGISAPICMQIFRPVLHSSLLNTALKMKEQEHTANEEAEKRLKAALTAKREPVTASRMASPIPGLPATPESNGDVKPPSEETTNADDAMDTEGSTTVAPVPESPWVPNLEALFPDIKKIAPADAYEIIGPAFYVTFWQLSTYDLAPPAASYDEEVAALRTLSRQEDSKYISADRSSDRTKRMTANSHRERRNRYNTFINVLGQEFKEQTVARAFTIKRLVREKQHWFSHSSKAIVLVESLVKHCIQPRCMISPMDADFCAQFIKVMHLQGTPGFHTLMCYDKLLGDHVKNVIFSCSEYESRNYGRFLAAILSDLYKWHGDEQLYLSENRTKIGGKTVYLPGMQQRNLASKIVVPENLLDWNGFHVVVRKWHRKLGKCFVECIQTGEFMHVYNAINVLKEILPVFPLATILDVGTSIDRTLDQYLKTEERSDLKIFGSIYQAGLRKREHLWAAKAVNKQNGASASPKPTSVGDKARISAPPTGPSSQVVPTGDGRRITQTSISAPSGPRAQSISNATQAAGDKPGTNSATSSKFSLENIPRPEVVKRVRPDTKTGDFQKPILDTTSQERADAESSERRSQIPSQDSRTNHKDDNLTPTRPGSALSRSRYNSPITGIDSSQSLLPASNSSLGATSTGSHPPSSLRNSHPTDDKALRTDSNPVMPPPSIPSQTQSAHELRETAKQTIIRPDKFDDRGSRLTVEPRSQNASAAPSPRPRSSSPHSRPGTRNPSNESRASGGRSRSDRGTVDDAPGDRRSDRENRSDSRDHATAVSRRDSITHNRGDRVGRDRTSMRDDDRKDADRDKDRDRGRDRHGDRHNDREREKERERDKEKDRERDRDRDRHRRDEKDRDRDSRKDREVSNRNSAGNAPPPPGDRALPTRPDPTRHRSVQNGDDVLGKRRRLAEDDPPERGSKRSSRKDGHRDDRNRRGVDKDVHDRNRDSDRRRKDRDGSENDSRVPPSDKQTGDKRNLEGPSSSSSKILPASTPSAPRAMSSVDLSRSKGDSGSGRDRHRDHPQSTGAGGSSSVHSSQQEGGSHGPGSLRSRIGDKEPPRSAPPPPTNSYRPDSSRKEDDRDSGRKRTMSEREKEAIDATPAPASDQTTQPPKRPRLLRNRYPSGQGQHALARKGLPINDLAGDKMRGRKD